MLKTLSRYYHTLKHLKPVQIRYQVWYRVRDRFFPVKYPEKVVAPGFQNIKLAPFPNQYTHYLDDNHFQFLNVDQAFKEEIDWNYLEHGKLWAYHLNYFDYLHQPGMDWETGKVLIDSFLRDPQNRPEGMEPYSTSLRTINWIKFLAVHDRYPKEIVDSLYAQYRVLTKKTEYHLLGNHLLENGFSLLFGAVFFRDEQLVQQARTILKAELDEQILDDGAHFELSPMYHLILLQRALDGYNLLHHNEHEFPELEQQLKNVVQKMVNWLDSILVGNGEIPMFNDSTYGQALKPRTVLEYARQSGFTPRKTKLTDSGYRKFECGAFEMVADVGEVGPWYQPGHAHCDLLSFVLYHKEHPLIVDRGISTYEKNSTRENERGTASHNTVMIHGEEQSDLWGGFRAGRKAKPRILEEDENTIKATHNGYKKLGIYHRRRWEMSDNLLKITDQIEGTQVHEAVAYFHFHPDREIRQTRDGNFRLNDISLRLHEYDRIEMETYSFCRGFNQTKDAVRLKVFFNEQLVTVFQNH